MRKSVKVILVLALLLIGTISFQLFATATALPFDNLFQEGFAGYTSDEAEVLTKDFVSSKHIDVTAGESVWFGPCDKAQYFHLVGLNAEGKAVTDKIRGKELEVTDTFNNDMVIYKYTVPEGVAKICISAPASMAKVYAVSKTEMSSLQWQAYWTLKGESTEDYIGQSSYYEVAVGDKLYFGAISEADAMASKTFDNGGNKNGTINKADLRLVESFGGELGIYCYTNKDSATKYIEVPYDTKYEQYYTCVKRAASETVTDEAVVDYFIAKFDIPKPISSTVEALKGQSALFLGDSITYGARDRANIYKYGSWAGRIGYFCDMDVLNNGVSGACITTARRESSSERHYIYNNLVAAKDQKFDYVIMHGMFNDASEDVEIGAPQGKAKFDPNKADVTKFADALELLFYTAGQQHPEATLGYIVNFHTDRAVDQTPYANIAIQICKDWGIQYLDLYNNKSFTVEFDDGLHPSSAGYDSMYTIVANWMATLKSGNASTDTTESTAKVMSYNVFWDTNDTVKEGITINNRTDKVQAVMENANADILMLQEVSGSGTGWSSKIVSFAEANGYAFYGYAHQGDRYIDSSATNKNTTASSDEMSPILWKKDKYDLVKAGHFWGSSTPEEPGSATWTSIGVTCSYPRSINWVVLKDKATNEQIVVVNYHAAPDKDGGSYENVRNLTAQLVAERADKVSREYNNAPVIMGGDWNMQRESVAYTTIISNGYGDAKIEAADSDGKNSYNAWNRPVSGFGVGDFLFGNARVDFVKYYVIDDIDPDGSGNYVSDHSPIVADIKY